jgi:hypothetical protein
VDIHRLENALISLRTRSKNLSNTFATPAGVEEILEWWWEGGRDTVVSLF